MFFHVHEGGFGHAKKRRFLPQAERSHALVNVKSDVQVPEDRFGGEIAEGDFEPPSGKLAWSQRLRYSPGIRERRLRSLQRLIDEPLNLLRISACLRNLQEHCHPGQILRNRVVDFARHASSFALQDAFFFRPV